MSKTIKSVTVVLSDAHHTIHLVEVRVLAEGGSSIARPKVDMVAAEAAARRTAGDRPWADGSDVVGVLMADLAGPSKGAIRWAEDFERKEVFA